MAKKIVGSKIRNFIQNVYLSLCGRGYSYKEKGDGEKEMRSYFDKVDLE
jgi:hypothetical protein